MAASSNWLRPRRFLSLYLGTPQLGEKSKSPSSIQMARAATSRAPAGPAWKSAQWYLSRQGRGIEIPGCFPPSGALLLRDHLKDLAASSEPSRPATGRMFRVPHFVIRSPTCSDLSREGLPSLPRLALIPP